MVEIYFHSDDMVKDSLKHFVVIMARYQNKWIIVRHSQRSTWELPGGRRENGEDISNAAARELFEESGSRKFRLYSVAPYSVRDKNVETFGHIFFAEVIELGTIPEYEIAEIRLVKSLPDDLTYPYLQSQIYQWVLNNFSFWKLKAQEYRF